MTKDRGFPRPVLHQQQHPISTNNKNKAPAAIPILMASVNINSSSSVMLSIFLLGSFVASSVLPVCTSLPSEHSNTAVQYGIVNVLPLCFKRHQLHWWDDMHNLKFKDFMYKLHSVIKELFIQ